MAIKGYCYAGQETLERVLAIANRHKRSEQRAVESPSIRDVAGLNSNLPNWPFCDTRLVENEAAPLRIATFD